MAWHNRISKLAEEGRYINLDNRHLMKVKFHPFYYKHGLDYRDDYFEILKQMGVVPYITRPGDAPPN
jgi:hypothetical protein